MRTGLDGDIKKFLLIQKPKTYKEAVRIAINYDEEVSPATRKSQRKLEIFAATEVNAISEQKRVLTCFNCQQPGHIAPQCPQPNKPYRHNNSRRHMQPGAMSKSQTQNNTERQTQHNTQNQTINQRQANSQPSKETRVCYNCNKGGHLARDCWSKKQAK